MKINEPVSPSQSELADKEHEAIALNQKRYLQHIAELIEAGENLNTLQSKFAAGAIRAFSDSIPLERKKDPGKPPKVPEHAVVLLQSYIESGIRQSEAEATLSEMYDVDIETFQSRIKRLRKTINPTEWGFNKWGAK
jgi:hypothetical protein